MQKLDYSKFSKEFKSQWEAIITDNKVTLEELQLFSAEDRKVLNEMLKSNPSIFNGISFEYIADTLQVGNQTIVRIGYSGKEAEEGLLDLKPDTLKKFTKEKGYSNNAHMGYLKDGVVTLYDKAGNALLDKNGEVVRYNMGEEVPKTKSSFASWYMEHNGGKFDIETLEAMQEIDSRLRVAEESDEDIFSIIRNIDLAELKSASEDDKQGFFKQLDAKAQYKKQQAKAMLDDAKQMLYEAHENGSLGEKGEALFNALMTACQVADNDIGLTKFKEFIKAISGINAAADGLTELADDGNDKNLSGLEETIELLKGAGRGLDSFIGTQGAAFIVTLAAAGKAAAVAGVGEAFSLITHAYFAYEGATLGYEGVKEAVSAETKEQAGLAGEKIGMSAIMLSGTGKAGKHAIDVKFNAKYSKMEPEQLFKELEKENNKAARGAIYKSLREKGYTVHEQPIVEGGKVVGTEPRVYNEMGELVEIDYQMSSDTRLLTPQDIRHKAQELMKDADINQKFDFMGLIDNLLEECKPESDYFGSSIAERIKYTANETSLKLFKPNLEAHRLKIIDTFLNNPELQTQRTIVDILPNTIERCFSAKEAERICKSLELYAKSGDKLFNTKYTSGSCMQDFLESDLSIEKKAVLLDIMKESEYVVYAWDRFVYNIKDSDDFNLALEMINDKKFGVDFAARFFDKNVNGNFNKILECRKRLYDVLKGDEKFFHNPHHNSVITSVSPINIEFVINNYKKLGGYAASISNCTQHNKKYVNFAQRMMDDGLKPELIKVILSSFSPEFIDNVIKDLYENPLVEKVEIPHIAKCFCRETVNKVLRTKFSNVDFIKTLIQDKEINNVFDLPELAAKYTPETEKIMMELYNDKEIPRKLLVDLTGSIKELSDTDFIKEKVKCLKKMLKLTDDLNPIKLYLQSIQKDNISLAKQLPETKGLNIDKFQKLLYEAYIDDANDAGGNNGHIDPKKVDKYTRLLQNPKTQAWAVKMINDGWDIETVSKLNPSKQTFHSGKPISEHTKAVDSDTQFFMDFGMEEKQASAIIKAIKKDGMIDIELQQSAVRMIQEGVPNNRIAEIINSSNISGEYNPKITEDAIKIKDLQINPLLMKNLPVLNNISGADVAVKFNPKIKKSIQAMLENLDSSIKQQLEKLGFDIDKIQSKLNSQMVRTETKTPHNKGEILSGKRTKASLKDFEKIIVNKYEPTEKIWSSEENCKKWAEEKYLSFKNCEYRSVRDGEHVDVKEINRQRTEGLKAWFEFMDTEPTIKNNPFIKVYLSDFITKDLLPENSSTPPALNKDFVKSILSDALEKGADISFSKMYEAKLNENAKKTSGAQEVEIDGRKMTWYTVPKTDSSHKNFKTNAAKVRAFSDGTNWCIRTWNAEPYIQQGNIHFLVDETGLTQVCIREEGRNTIAEIQKRQQNQTIPVAYIDFIKDYVSKNELKGCEYEIEAVFTQKPQFDLTKAKLQKLAEEKNYKAILEEMGISVKTLEDGSWEISHYTSYIKDICLNDYGIKENDLLSNVSIIRGNANFKDSNLTALPNLKEVGGELDFGYAEISNLKSLEKINGRKIEWE